MSAKTGKRPLRSLSAHEKLEAIRRVHEGESKASVARDIGVPESTLRGWCKNEDKISFLSRQSSSPEADDVVTEPKEKRIKLDEAIQPFNLSLKHSTSIYPNSSQSLYTPLDFSKTDPDTAHKTPQNLSLKIETPKSSATTATATPTTTTQMTEQELRRAELARLSIELGLNRPEMFPSSMNNTSNTISDLTQNLTLINAWNSLLMQQQLIQNGQTTKKMTNSEYLALANTLIQSIPAISSSMSKLQQSSTRLPKEQQQPQQQQPTTDDYIKSWLKIQEAAAVTAAVAANHANNSHNKTQMVSHNISTITTTLLTTTTTTTTPAVTTVSPASITATTSSSINNNNINTTATTAPATTTNLDAIYQNSLWKWNKELQQNQLNALTINKQQTENHKPILYQQLTKDVCDNDNNINKDNNNVNGKKIIKNPIKIRSILDNLLINNNHIETNNKQNNHELISRDEALMHGEKFMQWLESYSDPMVTAIQLTQFKNLLNNVRLGANRQNGDMLRNKTKERRK